MSSRRGWTGSRRGLLLITTLREEHGKTGSGTSWYAHIRFQSNTFVVLGPFIHWTSATDLRFTDNFADLRFRTTHLVDLRCFQLLELRSLDTLLASQQHTFGGLLDLSVGNSVHSSFFFYHFCVMSVLVYCIWEAFSLRLVSERASERAVPKNHELHPSAHSQSKMPFLFY